MSSRPRNSASPGGSGGVESLWSAELQRGLQARDDGDHDAARAAFARAHALAPDEAEPAFALAREETRRGRLDEAERLYRVALAQRPGWPLAAAALARVLVRRGQPTGRAALDEARRVLATARAVEPEHPLLHVVDGELALEAEDVEAARAAFERARAAGAEPRVVAAGLARVENLAAIALAAAERPDEAAFAFKRACDLDPAWAPPRANLGALLQRLGKRTQALAQYRRALALEPTHAPALFNLGLLLRERGDLDGAAQSLAAASTADPPHPDARLELALTLAERGEHGRALLLFEEELHKGSRPPALLHAYVGATWVRAGNLARAAAALEQALVLDPEHPAALRNLAYVYARTDRLIEAAALLQRAARNSGPPPESK